ncbi:hypothetical protein [Olsenella profusa]|uniref:Uncharacterized protein n=1 Tax=Olsenella profusa TaxID=138595 RepID=A0ABS2F091_9ACTN|nr:hypothetical protein [Olsenella profusa]MBM6774270.1 hypothetical protein [Olsenella profusa]
MRRRPLPVAAVLACSVGLALLLALAVIGLGASGTGPPADTSPRAEASHEEDTALTVGELVSSSGVRRRESELGVTEEAAHVLEERRAAGDCVVTWSGYLDLAGRTWGCVLQGSGWVELAVVREGPGGDGSEVVTLVMDEEDVEARVGGD